MSVALDPPYPFFGAKPKPIIELVWRALGDVPNYVEPCFGSGRILLGRPKPGKVETVNDKNGFITNFWRAVQADPVAVAAACDWIVSETDLYARHNYLMAQVEELTAKLEADPRYYDVEIAGWWAWGASSWIGSGWCTGTVHRKQPDLGGQGSEHRVRHGKGVNRRMPHLTRNNEGSPGGTGVLKVSTRQLPRVGGCDGSGVSYGAGINTRDRRGRLVEWFVALAERLHSGPVRVCCGDFARVLTPAVTTGHGLTGVVLDPPYIRAGRALGLYVDDGDDDHDDEAAPAEPAVRARDWAIAHGEDPLLRIVYFGYDDGFVWPTGWTVHAWKARGGYGNQAEKRGRENASRERVWFSPGCFPLDAQIGLML